MLSHCRAVASFRILKEGGEKGEGGAYIGM